MLEVFRRPRSVMSVLAAAVLLVLTSWAFLPGSAQAAQVSTKYPTVSVEAGESVTFSLSVTGTGERVSLDVVQAPKGWKTSLHGGGFKIGAVYAGPNTDASVSLEVSVPQQAESGTYPVRVRAQAPSGNSTLTVRLRVVKDAPGSFELTTDFAKLQGAADDTFSFSLTLANNTGEKGKFTLATRGPQGWQVDANPSMEPKATAVTVEPGSEGTIDLEVDPPDTVKAGTYPVAVRARGEQTVLTKKLTVAITGSAELSVDTKSERLNASGSAGDREVVKLVVSNKGSAPMRDVKLSAAPPTDWEVDFKPNKIQSVPPGKSTVVKARITPAGNAISGDYMVTLTAKSGTSSESSDIRYTVETSGWWGLVGVIVIILAIVALLWAFQRFGRR